MDTSVPGPSLKRRAYSVPANAFIQSLVALDLRNISDGLDGAYGGSVDVGTDLDAAPSQQQLVSRPTLAPHAPTCYFLLNRP